MEIEGKVIQILPLQQGVGKNGNSWALSQFILETFDQYPRKVCIDLFGEDRIKNNPVDIDDSIKVSYDLESREFNGRWYTSVRAWRVDKLEQSGANNVAPQPDPFPTTDLFGADAQQPADPFGLH